MRNDTPAPEAARIGAAASTLAHAAAERSAGPAP
jgi:hypothetical protein